MSLFADVRTGPMSHVNNKANSLSSRDPNPCLYRDMVIDVHSGYNLHYVTHIAALLSYSTHMLSYFDSVRRSQSMLTGPVI